MQLTSDRCPWIIIASAKALLSFMSGYACFLAPVAGILASGTSEPNGRVWSVANTSLDYWIVKRRRYDVPALYNPDGIYKYSYGTNWRALVTTIVVVGPLLPGMAHKISPDTVKIGPGLEKLFSFNWLYGFLLSIVMYVGFHIAVPDRQTTIPVVIHGTPMVMEGVAMDIESGRHSQNMHGKASMEISAVKEV